MKKKNVIFFVAGALAFIAIGFAAGRFTSRSADKPSETRKPEPAQAEKISEVRGGGYRFINPLWECDNFNPSQLNSIVKLRTDIHAYVQYALNEKKAQHVSVYFRDLNSGPWLGVNEREKFTPASLLKVPLLIAALKKAEADRSFFDTKFTMDKPHQTDIVPNVRDSSLVPGQAYTAAELMFRMIAYSDNKATDLLLKAIDFELYTRVMNDIGVAQSVHAPTDDYITVKDYSSFFRLLYNATYLNKEMSEKALALLSQSTFKKGIVAGVPDGITVAHKFGERALLPTNVRQLHDCGIIYRPGSPYLLCVMTRGTDFDQLAAVIAGVSEIVYRNTLVPN